MPLALVVAIGAGCGPSVGSSYFAPAEINVGNTKRLVLTDGYGRMQAQEDVALILIEAARGQQYFAVDAWTREADIDIRDHQASLTAAPHARSADELFVRFDVLEWFSESDTVTREVTTTVDGIEQTTFETVVHQTARVLLAATMIDDTGRVLAVERLYEGTAETDDDNRTEAELQHLAAEAAVQTFLTDITPRENPYSIPLDDEDEAQSHIIDAAIGGALETALANAKLYVEQKPENASAHYNLAALLDVSHRFEAALSAYDSAITLGAKDFYATSRGACAKRLESERLLAGGA